MYFRAIRGGWDCSLLTKVSALLVLKLALLLVMLLLLQELDLGIQIADRIAHRMSMSERGAWKGRMA